MANSGRVEINSSVTDSLRSVHGVIYVIFYGRIRIPRISGNFGACADSVHQALLSAHEREPGFEASIYSISKGLSTAEGGRGHVTTYMYCVTIKIQTLGPDIL